MDFSRLPTPLQNDILSRLSAENAYSAAQTSKAALESVQTKLQAASESALLRIQDEIMRVFFHNFLRRCKWLAEFGELEESVSTNPSELRKIGYPSLSEIPKPNSWYEAATSVVYENEDGEGDRIDWVANTSPTTFESISHSTLAYGIMNRCMALESTRQSSSFNIVKMMVDRDEDDFPTFVDSALVHAFGISSDRVKRIIGYPRRCDVYKLLNTKKFVSDVHRQRFESFATKNGVRLCLNLFYSRFSSSMPVVCAALLRWWNAGPRDAAQLRPIHFRDLSGRLSRVLYLYICGMREQQRWSNVEAVFM